MHEPTHTNTNGEAIEAMKGPKTFTIFDDERQPDFKFKPLSNKNIRAVCAIYCNSSYASDEERLYYADIGEINPDEIDEDTGKAYYKFKDIYASQAALYAALGAAMFQAFPDMFIIDENGTAKIKEESQELSDTLMRDKMHEAFTFFLGKFGEIPFGPANLLANFQTDPTGQTFAAQMINRISKANGMKPRAKDGTEGSPDNSDRSSGSSSDSPTETPTYGYI